MSDPMGRLASCVATGTVREIAEAAAELGNGVWLGVEAGWRAVGEGLTTDPGDDALQFEVGGYRIAMNGATEVAGPLVHAGLVRLAAQDARYAAESRLDLNERIAGLGSYDWNILADTNDWSEELFKIYGHEPGAFNASYAKFMELVHPDDRERIQAVHQQAYATGEPYEMEERIIRPDGSVRTLWSNGAVILDDDGTPVRMVGVCRDITEVREIEQRAAEQHDRIRNAEILRKQALDLNDNVVQGLTAVAWAIEGGTPLVARSVAEQTLDHARAMMHELLAAAQAPTEPGALVRDSAAQMVVGVAAPADVGPASAPPDTRCRVVLADDTEDLRMMLRAALELNGSFDVVGEADNGAQAVARVTELAPDAVVLDLSMPVMDGLEACGLIKSASPQTRVVILTGWGEETMGAQARACGADAYVQKGGSLATLMDAVLDRQELAAS